jgi:hypothetical protein
LLQLLGDGGNLLFCEDEIAHYKSVVPVTFECQPAAQSECGFNVDLANTYMEVSARQGELVHATGLIRAFSSKGFF